MICAGSAYFFTLNVQNETIHERNMVEQINTLSLEYYYQMQNVRRIIWMTYA